MNNVPSGVGGAFWIGCCGVILVGCGAIAMGVVAPKEYSLVGLMGVLIIGFCGILLYNRLRGR